MFFILLCAAALVSVSVAPQPLMLIKWHRAHAQIATHAAILDAVAVATAASAAFAAGVALASKRFKRGNTHDDDDSEYALGQVAFK